MEKITWKLFKEKLMDAKIQYCGIVDIDKDITTILDKAKLKDNYDRTAKVGATVITFLPINSR